MSAEFPASGSFEDTTLAVQRYLDSLAADASSDAAVRALLGRSVRRLERLCGALLHRAYPRLTRAPLAVETGDVLGAVVERLLGAVSEVRPRTVREFFGLANRHIRWQLNDLARSLDGAPAALLPAIEEGALAPEVTDSGLSPALRRLLEAIEGLPQDEREVFDLVRVQELTHGEAATVIGVSTKTVQRRLHSAMLLLAEKVGDVGPGEATPAE